MGANSNLKDRAILLATALSELRKGENSSWNEADVLGLADQAGTFSENDDAIHVTGAEGALGITPPKTAYDGKLYIITFAANQTPGFKIDAITYPVLAANTYIYTKRGVNEYFYVLENAAPTA